MLYYYSLEAFSFSNEKQKGVAVGETGGGAMLRGDEGRETVIRVYYARKNDYFQ